MQILQQQFVAFTSTDKMSCYFVNMTVPRGTSRTQRQRERKKKLASCLKVIKTMKAISQLGNFCFAQGGGRGKSPPQRAKAG
jgi:hypothetical protein